MPLRHETHSKIPCNELRCTVVNLYYSSHTRLLAMRLCSRKWHKQRNLSFALHVITLWWQHTDYHETFRRMPFWYLSIDLSILCWIHIFILQSTSSNTSSMLATITKTFQPRLLYMRVDNDCVTVIVFIFIDIYTYVGETSSI